MFNQIHKQATREQKLKEKLIHMQTWLNDLHYRMAKYRPPIRTTQSKSSGLFSRDKRVFFSWKSIDIVLSTTIESISRITFENNGSFRNDYGYGNLDGRSVYYDQFTRNSSINRSEFQSFSFQKKKKSTKIF